jgi:uncharacterized protein (DUF362 family)
LVRITESPRCAEGRVTAGSARVLRHHQFFRDLVLHTDIDSALAGLTEMMKPTLTVVDAMRVLMRGGPAGGNLSDVKEVGAVAVSVDPVAADAWAARAVGVSPGEVRSLVLAEQRALGRAESCSRPSWTTQGRWQPKSARQRTPCAH